MGRGHSDGTYIPAMIGPARASCQAAWLEGGGRSIIFSPPPIDKNHAMHYVHQCFNASGWRSHHYPSST
jgi:hypothetical protein